MLNHQCVLSSELKKRKAANQLFSMRSFARVLGISPSHLSHLINGKRNLTRKQAIKISEKLGLSSAQAQKILGSTISDSKTVKADSKRSLKEDELLLISDWYHFAILSLGKIKNNKASASWISKQLGITVTQAADAFERLQRLQLVKVSGGHFCQSSKDLTTSTEVSSAAIRNYHRQKLDLAKEKLESVPLELREFGSITMAANLDKLKSIKNRIQEFRDEICEEMEHGELTEVYTLAIQLFPLTNNTIPPKR